MSIGGKRVLVEEKPRLLGSLFAIYDNLEIHKEYDEVVEDEFLGEVDINYNQVKRMGIISLVDISQNVKEIDFVVEEYLGRKCVVRKKS